jgi:hypothetical protein
MKALEKFASTSLIKFKNAAKKMAGNGITGTKRVSPPTKEGLNPVIGGNVNSEQMKYLNGKISDKLAGSHLAFLKSRKKIS